MYKRGLKSPVSFIYAALSGNGEVIRGPTGIIHEIQQNPEYTILTASVRLVLMSIYI